MRAKKTDTVQGKIVQGLRDLGFHVEIISHVGHGWPDIVVPHGGFNWFFEIKSPKGRLTPAQKEFHSTWSPLGQIDVIRSVEDAIEIMAQGVCR